MFGMNETYVSPEERAYDKFVNGITKITGPELVTQHESIVYALFEDGATVQEAAEEIRVL